MMASRDLRRFLVLVILCLLSVPLGLDSHGGGLDSLGCHHNRKLGGYHCHRGPLAGRSFASKDEALKALEKLKGAGEAGERKSSSRHSSYYFLFCSALALCVHKKVRLIGV